jgi:hypothetical protein
MPKGVYTRRPYVPSGAGAFGAGKDDVSKEDVAARLAERNERADRDDRSPAQQWLNDPPRGRSALAAKLRRP